MPIPGRTFRESCRLLLCFFERFRCYAWFSGGTKGCLIIFIVTLDFFLHHIATG